MIDYKKVEAGDVLQVVGEHIVNGRIALAIGAIVKVVKTYRAAVDVRDATGAIHSLAFEHGAEKLKPFVAAAAGAAEQAVLSELAREPEVKPGDPNPEPLQEPTPSFLQKVVAALKTGPPGPQGDRGDTGPAGPQGAPGVFTVTPQVEALIDAAVAAAVAKLKA